MRAPHAWEQERFWITVSASLPLLLVAAGRLGTVDLAYHLRAGRMMLESGALLRTDSFTFTAAGLPWFDQQWLSQLVFAVAYGVAGWLGLAVLQLLLSGTTLLALGAAARARGASTVSAAWLTLGAAVLLVPSLQLRPQLFGITCFALAQWLLSTRERHPARLWYLMLLSLLWANLHGSFPLAIGLIGLAWLHDIERGRRPGWRLIATGTASIAAMCCTPFGAQVFTYVVSLSGNGAVRSLVTEWQRPAWDSFSGAMMYLSLAVVTYLVWRAARGQRPGWAEWLTLASFAALGLQSVRGVCWWALVVPVVLATAMRAPAVRTPVPRATAIRVATVLLMLSPIALLARWLPYHSADLSRHAPPAAMLTHAPRALTQSLATLLQPNERLFAAQAWGSWFELALPTHPVVVDSRIELFPAGVWAQYSRVARAETGWQKQLEVWRVRVVAVYPSQQPLLLKALAQDSAWTRRYNDADGAIFVRR